MAGLPPAVVPRLGALLRMLGSPVDGEALGAARAIGRTLNGAGVDFHTLADVVERGPETVFVERPAPAPRRTRRARAASSDSVEIGPARRRQVIDALSKASRRGALSAWEGEFATSVITILRGTRPRLSARQVEIVERIMLKIGEAGSWG